jgi:hypothetical protein
LARHPLHPGRRLPRQGLLALVAALLSPAVASATHGGDREVTVGSNDNIDLEACNAGDPTTRRPVIAP